VTTFVDTSAVYAFLDRNDAAHDRATVTWERLSAHTEPLVTSNYVVVETISLVARRLGFGAIRELQRYFPGVVQVHWVDRSVHDRALTTFLTAGLRDLSLVDCVSFEVIRELGLDSIFAFDPHFQAQGFPVIPDDPSR
jgi:uncharacterized protein